MATQTEHLGLHQWEPEDSFLREDFNQDFAKIDAGIKAAAELPYVVGTVNIPSSATVVTKVELGFTPSAVIVGSKMGIYSAGGTNSSTYGCHAQGFAVQGAPSHAVKLLNEIGGVSVEVVEWGFTIAGMRYAANPYRYIAFR